MVSAVKISKSKIDRAGVILSDTSRKYDEVSLEMDYIFEEYRKSHLEPLTRLTLELQGWMRSFGGGYFIAQRLKRRPQILRKLRRLSVRLTQLQDIGGCRIIVDSNADVGRLVNYIRGNLQDSGFAKVLRETDYRELGRDDTGYRAFHFVLEKSGAKLELQVRSRIQHYWSESIERTSVIYGKRLKEKEGDPEVIDYFKVFSNALHSIEIEHDIPRHAEIDLERRRLLAEAIILQASAGRSLGGHVNSDIVRTMADKESKSRASLNNWILVFDWNDGNFVFWDVVGRDPNEAISAYSRYEIAYPEEDKYEVVLIGTSDISTVPTTHSHYFGIEHHNKALEGMEASIIGLSKRSQLDVGARRILMTMARRKYWGKNTIKVDTLRNHFCQSVATFDLSLQTLQSMKFVVGGDPVSLDIKRSAEIYEFV